MQGIEAAANPETLAAVVRSNLGKSLACVGVFGLSPLAIVDEIDTDWWTYSDCYGAPARQDEEA